MQQAMAEAVAVSGEISGADGKMMGFETGKLAGLADGAVVGRLGDTHVLVTATAAKNVREGIDFFPLTVDIEERMYAAGKIPGSFFRREGRASDSAILTCRLIDRPLRPSFPDGFRNEVHVVGTVLGADQENPYDVLEQSPPDLEGDAEARRVLRFVSAVLPWVEEAPDDLVLIASLVHRLDEGW